MYGIVVWHKWVIKKIQFDSPVQKFMDRSNNQVPLEDLKMSKRLILQAKWAGEEGFLQVSGATRKAAVRATQDHMTAVLTSGGIRNPHGCLQVEAAHNTHRMSPPCTPRMEGRSWSLMCKAYSSIPPLCRPSKVRSRTKEQKKENRKGQVNLPSCFSKLSLPAQQSRWSSAGENTWAKLNSSSPVHQP